MIFKKYPPLKSGPPEISVIQREFRTNEGTTDYATIPEVTLAGNFVIELEVLLPSTTGQEMLMSGGADTYLAVTDTGSVVAKFGGTYAASSATSVRDGLFHKIKASSISSRTIISLDDVEILNIGNAGASNVFHELYRFTNASQYLNGILANLKIYDSGTLVRDYPINDGKNILANVATALGSEIDGLTYALTTAIGGVASVVLSSLSVIGKTYLVEVSYSGVVGDASVRIGGFSGPSFTGTGTIEFIATATTAVNDILGALTGVTSGSVTVSIKEAEGYGTIINGNDDDWGLFDKQANGDWLGQELVVQPINLLNDWANVGGGLIQTASTWNTSATGGIRIASPSWVGGVSVRINAEVYANSSDISVKDSATGQGADPTIATITANTQMSAEVDYVTMNGGLYLRSTGETEGNELFSLSVKEVLKNA